MKREPAPSTSRANSRNRSSGISRRACLALGSSLFGSSLFGLSWAGLLNAKSLYAATPAAPPGLSPLKACIVVFYYGGPSHLDTYDPKPEAPAEVRGEFNTISTSVPGLPICEHLPHMAQVMHHVGLIKSMHHANRLHDSAATETFTGRPPPNGDVENFNPFPQLFPCHGSTLHYLWRNEGLNPAHVALPWTFHNVVDVPCQGGGFLGKTFDPFWLSGDPQTLAFKADSLTRPAELSADRVEQRLALVTALEKQVSLASLPAARQVAQNYSSALELMQSQSLQQAMRLEEEPESVRQAYGMGSDWVQGGGNGAEFAYGRNIRGQNLLAARRLVEAGIPFVNVYDYRQQGQNWDSHSQNFVQNKQYLLPPADKALAALITDLRDRGLLESTLVVALGEFGRTPKINGTAGRDHWPDCYSVLFAGGGVLGGYVHGASDKLGAYPAKDPVSPADLAATIYWRFGFDPKQLIHDLSNRPWHLADGHPVTALFGL